MSNEVSVNCTSNKCMFLVSSSLLHLSKEHKDKANVSVPNEAVMSSYFQANRILRKETINVLEAQGVKTFCIFFV